MKESLGQLLDHWRHNVWADIRPSDDDLCECFLPEYVIVERAHVCTSLENLRIIADGFDYMDEYGPQLLEYLTKIVDGFEQIFEERKDGSDPESESSEGSATYGIQLRASEALCAERAISSWLPEVLKNRATTLREHFVKGLIRWLDPLYIPINVCRSLWESI